MTATRPTPDWIALDGAVNARAVVPRVLLRSDNLQGLSDADVDLLVGEHGLELVLDLRTDVEVRMEGPGPLTGSPQVRIEHRSLHPDSNPAEDVVQGTTKPWGSHALDEDADEHPVVRAYLSYLRRRPDSIVASVRAIARANGAVLVHCAAGKDRTGVIVALALDAAGVDRPTIVQDYLLSAERIEQIVARLRASPTYRRELEGVDPQALAPQPGTMERLLAVIDERFGGAASWLRDHGLDDADLDRLAARLSPLRG